MTPPARPSRFRGSKAAVSRAVGDDVVSSDQRSRRAGALRYLLHRMMVDTPPAYDEFLAEQGLLLDAQDRNDAVLVGQQTADGWIARWVLADQDGVLVPRALLLEPSSPATPPGGITTNLLRELSPATAVADVAAHTFDRLDEVLLKWTAGERRRHGPAAPVKPTRGRPPVPRAELAAVAEAYLDEVGKGPGVTRRIGQRLDMVEDTVRDRIRMARDREFLTPTKRGRRGGSPGPALLNYRTEALEEEADHG